MSARRLSRGDGVKKTLELELDISVSCLAVVLFYIYKIYLYRITSSPSVALDFYIFAIENIIVYYLFSKIR